MCYELRVEVRDVTLVELVQLLLLLIELLGQDLQVLLELADSRVLRSRFSLSILRDGGHLLLQLLDDAALVSQLLIKELLDQIARRLPVLLEVVRPRVDLLGIELQVLEGYATFER